MERRSAQDRIGTKRRFDFRVGRSLACRLCCEGCLGATQAKFRAGEWIFALLLKDRLRRFFLLFGWVADEPGFAQGFLQAFQRNLGIQNLQLGLQPAKRKTCL